MTAACGIDAKGIACAIGHTVGVAGIQYMALGSDVDGAVSVPFDVTDVVQIVDALLAEGFAQKQIAMVKGGNAVRVRSQALPRESAASQ